MLAMKLSPLADFILFNSQLLRMDSNKRYKRSQVTEYHIVKPVVEWLVLLDSSSQK